MYTIERAKQFLSCNTYLNARQHEQIYTEIPPITLENLPSRPTALRG